MNFSGIIAKKIGMSRMFDKKGNLVPVTLLQIEPQAVTKTLSIEHNGYTAYQVGYQEKKAKNLTKPDLGRLKKTNTEANYSKFKEFRLESKAETPALGTKFDANTLEGIGAVDVTGFTKGRGFTGSLKKWNTARGRMTHGSRFHRRPGSLGTRTTPGRVFKGKPQHGQYGCDRVTILNLTILDLDKMNNVVTIQGSVPGFNNGYVWLRPSIKAD